MWVCTDVRFATPICKERPADKWTLIQGMLIFNRDGHTVAAVYITAVFILNRSERELTSAAAVI